MNDSVIGTEVEGYRIQEVLGRGGMGVVYKAEDVALSRDVALKRINPSLANDEAFLRRFRSEARALARIDSPYIVSVHALRQTEIGLLLVMEYVKGGTLKDLTRKGPMDWQEALPIVKQMLTALEHAHGAEVIHRDIKPQNVMLSEDGTVKVTDFGLAKVHRPDSNKTVTQGVFGTLNYMSPEQVQGSADLDHRSDLYSLGMTIYEMLAGDLPFDEDSNEFTKMRKIVEEELPRPDELYPQVPEGLSALVMDSLEKDPDDRFQSAKAMREAFEAYEQTQGDGAPSPETSDSEPSDYETRGDGAAERPPSAPTDSASSSGRRWSMIGGLVALVVLVVGGGTWLFLGAPTTRLAVFTEPGDATLFVDGERVGTTPSGTTIEGSTAQVRIEKAGFVPVDTTLAQLGSKDQLDLRLSLTREERTFTLQSDPEKAQVSIDGEEVGRTPVSYTTRKGSVRVRFERDGYRPGDTLLAVAQLDQDGFEMPLEPRSEPDPQVGDNGDNGGDPGGNNTTNATANNTGGDTPTGTLTLGTSPAVSASVEVDGQSRGTGESIRLEAGSEHHVRISHPEYGTCETTLTVAADEPRSLTCYFERQVVVRSEPWAQIFLDGENTGESTNHTMQLHTGKTYTIKVRILSRPYEVTGGTYRRVATENYEVITEEEFQGNTKSITLRPSFGRETYGLEFRTTETGSSR